MGNKISYRRSESLRAGNKKKHFHVLSFTIPVDKCDSLKIAYSYPYTLTKLKHLLTSISSTPLKSKHCRI
jgi:hypothetical protein